MLNSRSKISSKESTMRRQCQAQQTSNIHLFWSLCAFTVSDLPRVAVRTVCAPCDRRVHWHHQSANSRHLYAIAFCLRTCTPSRSLTAATTATTTNNRQQASPTGLDVCLKQRKYGLICLPKAQHKFSPSGGGGGHVTAAALVHGLAGGYGGSSLLAASMMQAPKATLNRTRHFGE